MEFSQTELGSMSAKFVETLLQMQSFLDNLAQNVNRNSNLQLTLDGVFRHAVKQFDS